jgi:hypothetical protein
MEAARRRAKVEILVVEHRATDCEEPVGNGAERRGHDRGLGSEERRT